MKLEPAIRKSWDDLSGLNMSKNTKVVFLGDEYMVNLRLRQVLSLPDNAPVEDHLTVLILHYLLQKAVDMPVVCGEYLSFNGLSVISSFAEMFKKRAADVILEKYGDNIFNIFSVLQNLPAKKIDRADAAIIIEAFKGVPILIELWKADEEFGPEVNILFDKSITKIFCVEDVVVLAEVVAEAISSGNDYGTNTN